MKRPLVLLTLALIPSVDLAAQAVPPASQAASVADAYRRSPSRRNDPFRQVFLPYWGVVMSVGATAANNALNVQDLSDLLVNNRDAQVIDHVVSALGRVPPGSSVDGQGQGEGGFYFGGPVLHRLNVGVSLQGRGYGSFRADSDAVVLLRDGIGGQQRFSLGDTRVAGIATSEVGLHALVRLDPLGSVDGPQVSVGIGGRYVRPVAFGSGRSLIDSRLAVVGDSIAARIGVVADITPGIGLDQGSGVAGDFLVRLVWPTAGFAVEAMVANVGEVRLPRVERQSLQFSVQSTSLAEVNDSLEAAVLQVQDTVQMDVALPRIVRLGATAWANSVLQLDASATLPAGGYFETPLVVDLGSTWRVLPILPLRAGLVLGGYQRIGYTAGMGVETRHFLLELAGGSLGGLLDGATGLSGRMDLGFFF